MKRVFSSVAWESGLRPRGSQWESSRGRKYSTGYLGEQGGLGKARADRPGPILGHQGSSPPEAPHVSLNNLTALGRVGMDIVM